MFKDIINLKYFEKIKLLVNKQNLPINFQSYTNLANFAAAPGDEIILY